MPSSETHQNQIFAMRQRAGMSQTHLAELCGLAQSYVSQLENGRIVPTVPTARKIADVLGCSLDDLYPGEAA